MSDAILVKVFDAKTESWIVIETKATRWEDISRNLQYIRFHEFTVFYGNEYPVILGEKE